MGVPRPGRLAAVLSGAALTAAVVVAAVVLVVRRVHAGSAVEQDLTATTLAADLAAVALAVTMLGLLAAWVRRTAGGASGRAALLAADAVGTAGGRWAVAGAGPDGPDGAGGA